MNQLHGQRANACAKWFVKRGIPVFPLRRHAKTPANHNGFKGATLDVYDVDDWWAVESQSALNVGVPTGVAFDVIDIDRHGHVNGFDTLATLQWSALLDRPTNAIVATAGAGLHLWVPATGAGNTAAWAPGIDYRGVGGYVVAPPSVTPESEWRFIQPYSATPRLATDGELRAIDKVIWP